MVQWCDTVVGHGGSRTLRASMTSFLFVVVLSKATGVDAPDTGRLSHIYQLSGFADPVYAEACVTVHDYDIVLEVRCAVSLRFKAILVCIFVACCILELYPCYIYDDYGRPLTEYDRPLTEYDRPLTEHVPPPCLLPLTDAGDQSHPQHPDEPDGGAVHHGRSSTRGEAAVSHHRAARLAQHPRQHQGEPGGAARQSPL